MNGTAVKPGQTVTTFMPLDSYLNNVVRGVDPELEWTVLDRAPQAASWHLHRWIDGNWETCISHARDLRLVRDEYRGPNGRIQAKQLQLI